MNFVENGYHLKTGQNRESWFLVGLIYNNVDSDFAEHQVRPESRNKYDLKPGKTMEEWIEADGRQKRTIFLHEAGNPLDERRVLSTSERIFGPAVPYEVVENPTAAWVEKNGEDQNSRYSLILLQGDSVQDLISSKKMLRKPSITLSRKGIYSAFLIDEDCKTLVRIIDESGATVFSIEGRDPVLRSDGERLFLLFDTTKPNVIEQNLLILGLDGSVLEGFYELRADDLNFAADMRYHPERKMLSMAWETAPVWGADPAVGYHRDLAYAEIDFNGELGPIEPEIIPVEKRAYYELRKTIPRYAQNAAPVNPIVVFDGDTPSVAYKAFSFVGHRTFGWDAYMIQKTGDEWGSCRKLIERYGPPDTGYGVEFVGDRRITSMAVNHSVNTPKAIYDLGILIDDQERNHYFPDTHIPFIRKAFYNIGFPLPDAAPPIEETTHDGYSLVWVDMHVHSCYSKCQANKDGTPLANLRFTRDVLGNRVLSHAEHYMFMNGVEVAWVCDRLEEEAGDNCLWIYGNEALGWPSHDTNTFCIDRSINDRLRTVLNTCVHRSDDAYPSIKKHLPAGSVIAVRHFHGKPDGEHSITDPRTVDTHDPDLELTMESMQVRGNFMQEQGAMLFDLPQFPNNFLNAGKKVGVVGGSDHSTAPGDQNAFCLTGIWINEFTREALFEAIKHRRTIAASNGKVSVWATMNGFPAGSEVAVSEALLIKVDIKSHYPLIRVSLMADGEMVDSRLFEDDTRKTQVIFEPEVPDRAGHWYSIHIQAYSAHTMGDGYPVDDLDYPWLIVNTSPWFVNSGSAK